MDSGPVDADRKALEDMRDYAERVLRKLDAKKRVADAFDVPVVLLEDPYPAEDVEEWWLDVAKADFAAMAPKVEEYGGTDTGSADLQIMGNALAELMGMHDAPDAVKQEMACWFYALGKISRLVSDYKQGKPGKPDTWHDLTVYSMMARRLQAVGRWP